MGFNWVSMGLILFGVFGAAYVFMMWLVPWEAKLSLKRDGLSDSLIQNMTSDPVALQAFWDRKNRQDDIRKNAIKMRFNGSGSAATDEQLAIADAFFFEASALGKFARMPMLYLLLGVLLVFEIVPSSTFGPLAPAFVVLGSMMLCAGIATLFYGLWCAYKQRELLIQSKVPMQTVAALMQTGLAVWATSLFGRQSNFL